MIRRSVTPTPIAEGIDDLTIASERRAESYKRLAVALAQRFHLAHVIAGEADGPAWRSCTHPGCGRTRAEFLAIVGVIEHGGGAPETTEPVIA